jgi:hypothetical protein
LIAHRAPGRGLGGLSQAELSFGDRPLPGAPEPRVEHLVALALDHDRDARTDGDAIGRIDQPDVVAICPRDVVRLGPCPGVGLAVKRRDGFLAVPWGEHRGDAAISRDELGRMRADDEVHRALRGALDDEQSLGDLAPALVDALCQHGQSEGR